MLIFNVNLGGHVGDCGESRQQQSHRPSFTDLELLIRICSR